MFQLGLDQIPDASSASIISCILIFVPICFVGFWISDSLFTVIEYCTDFNMSLQDMSLLPVLSMCVLLASLSSFGQKWLIIEPKSPQSLENIYRVLKFAAKYKALLNRSALTY